MDRQKTAWIIGASSGIGKSLALLLAEKNWQVLSVVVIKVLLMISPNYQITYLPMH